MAETNLELPPIQTLFEILNHIIFRHPSLSGAAATTLFNSNSPDMVAIAQNYLRSRQPWHHEKSEFLHRHIVPYATFAPWLADGHFLDIHRKIEQNTLVDIYRCYEIWTLAKQASRMEGNILEVGVWRGGTGALLAEASRSSGKTVYLADTFVGVVKAGEKDTRYTGGEHSDTSIEVVKKLLADLRLDNVHLLQGIFPDETGRLVDGKIAMLHCDVDVYSSTKDIVEWAVARMEVGSIVVFDDYGFHGCEGVTTFCEEFRANDDFMFMHNLNGHAIFIKVA